MKYVIKEYDRLHFKYVIEDEHGRAIGFANTMWGARLTARKVYKKRDHNKVVEVLEFDEFD